MTDAIKSRPIYAIAADIRSTWIKPNYAAVPYINAMRSINSINDMYIHESARSVVLYFLANAGTWRGETAKRVKAELKAMLANK